MKLTFKLFLVVIFMFCGVAFAEPFKVLVLPVDIFSVCENYYCFPEMSEIVASDVIDNFNASGKVVAPSLYDVRKKLNFDKELKTSANNSLHKFEMYDSIDFPLLKKLSKGFGTNSILLISSSVNQDKLRRSVWEVMEISGVFSAVSRYNLTTYAVLTDNVNDVVMWGGKFSTSLGDNESRFWAKSPAQAVSWLEKLKFYSKDIVSLNIVQNIMLRFYPRVNETPIIKPAAENSNVSQTDASKAGTEQQPHFGTGSSPFNPFGATRRSTLEDYSQKEIEIDTNMFSF